MKGESQILTATVFVFSEDGRSPLSGDNMSSMERMRLRPDPEKVRSICQWLEEKGFEVGGVGATVSFSGTEELFETVFELSKEELSAEDARFNHPDLATLAAGMELQRGGILF